MDEKLLRIQELKKEKNAVILAHYYTPDEVQAVSDFVGDSFYLSQIAEQVQEQTIVMCGVRFMGESAKILNPDKTVLLPAANADCPMAHMATVERIAEMQAQYDDLAVVCYVNSTAELKMHADVCVTSANALKIVKALPNHNIFFIPDENLGRFVAAQIPEKHFIFNDGCCPVHAFLSAADVRAAKAAHPGAPVLVHPECRPEVSALADYAGSTAGIIRYAGENSAGEFIIGTEHGVLYELKKQNPGKKFYPLHEEQICPNMKRVTLDKVIAALENGTPAVHMDADSIRRAHAPLQRMLDLS
ncbi:MAG: quinolinate synthase NadA [Oscillospiraceae bacterium]|jgi:quinolinate synthase|nr:quinolinate synthase NadA [Oscillospiraceae bacterium]